MGSPKQKGSDAYSTGASVCHLMANRSGGSLDDDARLGLGLGHRPICRGRGTLAIDLLDRRDLRVRSEGSPHVVGASDALQVLGNDA